MTEELDLSALLRETGALLNGHFRLSSGLHSPSYVQCALLLEHPRNASRIGRALAGRLRGMNPALVASPALGGVLIGYAVAEALGVPMMFTERKEGVMQLRRGFSVRERGPIVIVEDVVTTGKSTRETAEALARNGGVVAGFGSVLNRSGVENPFDAPYEALMRLDLETWSPESCPLCEKGAPIDSPGSRDPSS